MLVAMKPRCQFSLDRNDEHYWTSHVLGCKADSAYELETCLFTASSSVNLLKTFDVLFESVEVTSLQRGCLPLAAMYLLS
jgi:hypothetical protein